MKKKVVFPRGKQKEFLINSKVKLNISWLEFAEKLNMNRGTLEKSYRYEWSSLPYNTFIGICNLINKPIEFVIKEYKLEIVLSSSVKIIGRKVMGESRTKLPESNIKFENNSMYIDLSFIKGSRFDKLKNMNFPDKLTSKLAEEIGISLGDGFISNKKYEYRLKGGKDEKEYYDKFIKLLYKGLFNIEVNIKEYETTYGFELYSKAFWDFKTKCLKIPAGRKDNIKIPTIIKINDQDILVSFIRGIFDTDGSIYFSNKYSLGNYYPIISINLKSDSLIFEVADILDMLGFEPKLARSKGYLGIYLNGYRRFEKYSKLVGWNNPKNINKIIKWKERYPDLSKNIMVGMVQLVSMQACGA